MRNSSPPEKLPQAVVDKPVQSWVCLNRYGLLRHLTDLIGTTVGRLKGTNRVDAARGSSEVLHKNPTSG